MNKALDDMHVWLDPKQAMKMVKSIAHELGHIYPQNHDIYETNAHHMIEKLTALDKELKESLFSVKNKPFVVFHDAYQYFENAYELTAVGSITVEPHIPPSPNRIKEIHNKLREKQAKCLFREPQFSDRLINTIIEGTNTKRGVLDPLGANLKDGPELYINLLRDLAKNLKKCL